EAGREGGLRVVGIQFVAGELLAEESVVGLVVVEGVDDVVAVTPGEGAWVVRLEAVALGEAGEVEPERGPALAVLRRGRDPLNDPVVGVGGGARGAGRHR